MVCWLSLTHLEAAFLFLCWSQSLAGAMEMPVRSPDFCLLTKRVPPACTRPSRRKPFRLDQPLPHHRHVPAPWTRLSMNLEPGRNGAKGREASTLLNY